MSDFGVEGLFDQGNCEINDHLNDAFHDPLSYLLSKTMNRQDQPSFGPLASSPSISSSQSIQPSHSAMSQSSVISGNSTSSSDMGSPFTTIHPEMEHHLEEWSKTWGHSAEPSILQSNAFPLTFMADTLEDGDHFQSVDTDRPTIYDAPHVIQPYDMPFLHHGLTSGCEGFLTDLTTPMQASSFPPQSPALTRSPPYESTVANAIPSLGSNLANRAFPPHGMSRQVSVGSPESGFSKGSPRSMTAGFDEDSNERGRCPYPGCGRHFKDLRAHKLTHQSERPEKCPIEKCQYHIKGFARKYDQTRHTLTHYKGTMVCGFCPGSGSASEKSFNRADVFKRHLTSMHGVEQTPANCRRKTPNTAKKVSTSKDEKKEGKCSTCGTVFGSAQDFYNHLDDCVMKILEKPEVSEAHNERHLTNVSGDQNVKATLERNNLPIDMDSEVTQGEVDEDDEMDDDDEETPESKGGQTASHRPGKATRGMTHSKGGIPTVSKSRRKRKYYPHSWNCRKEQMKTKKRVLCVFDGQRRLCKDEMMMDNDYEVRIPLGVDTDKYVTDLDYMTLKRAGAIHDATEEEKGPYLKDEEVTKLML